jgi:hypothetical protein
MTHANLIKDLGDTGVVAAELGIGDTVVSMWKRRGVSWKWRPAVAALAEKRDIPLPAGFLDPASPTPSQAEAA